MRVQFESADHSITDNYRLRWYLQGGPATPAFEQTVNKGHAALLAGTTPPRYEIPAPVIQKPANPPAGAFYTLRVVADNNGVLSAESAPTPPFSVFPPPAPPANVAVVDPHL